MVLFKSSIHVGDFCCYKQVGSTFFFRFIFSNTKALEDEMTWSNHIMVEQGP